MFRRSYSFDFLRKWRNFLLFCSIVIILKVYYHSSSYPSTSSVLFGSCRIHPAGAWSKSVKKIAEPDFDIKKDCNKTNIPLTTLDHGKIKFNTEANPETLANVTYCEARCLMMYTEWHLANGTTITVFDRRNGTQTTDHVFQCDIVETACSNTDDHKVPFYRYIHHQIFEYYGEKGTQRTTADVSPKLSNPPRSQPSTILKGKKPHVILLILDSMSDFHFERALVKTKHYLEQEMKAVRFRRNTKLGRSSYTNGQAMLFNRQLEDVDRTQFKLPSLPAEISFEDACHTANDNATQFIFRRFDENGYRLSFAEDWAKGIFMHPDCEGFKKFYAHHIMKPLTTRRSMHSTPLLSTSLHHLKGCWLMSEEIVKWMDNNMQSYQGQPKFISAWITETAHDSRDLTFSQDEMFLKLLQNNRKMLDDAFVIITGDHGKHWGKYRQETETGEYEEKNPMFAMSVPAELRDNRLVMETLKENSNQMMTHFDTYATLHDIAVTLPRSQFRDFSSYQHADHKGKSLLRPFGKEERNCKNLPINFAFCACDFPMEPPALMDDEFDMIGTAIVQKINSFTQPKYVEDCVILTLNETFGVWGYVPLERTQVYMVNVRANPSGGEFQAIINMERPLAAIMEDYKQNKTTNGVRVSDSIARLNAYGTQSSCVSDWRVIPYCYCHQQVENIVGNKTMIDTSF